MTMTPPPSGTSRRRRGAGFAVAALLVLAPVAAVADTPTPEPTIGTGVAELTIAPVGNGVVQAGDSLTVSVTVTNGTDAVLPRTPVTVSLGTAALTDRTALSQWLAGGVGGFATTELEHVTVPAVAPYGTQITGVGVDAQDDALEDLAPGVYPLLAEYELAGDDGVATSVVIVPDDEVSAEVAIVVPVVAPTTTEGLLTAEELAGLTAEDGPLTALLDAVAGTPAILAVDPAIPAAIRVLGTSAPASATAWLERLERLSNPRFALQFGDADPGVQMQAERTRLAAPTSLQAYMSAGDFAPRGEATPPATPTPSPTEDPSAPAYPTLEELLDIGAEAPGTILWPAVETTSPASIAALGAATPDDDAPIALVGSKAIAEGAAGGTVTARARADGTGLLVIDDDISDALLAASLDDAGPARRAALTEATAYLALASADADGAPLLVSLGRAVERSQGALASTIAAVTRAPGVSTAGLAEVRGASAVEVGLADAATDQTAADAASALFDDESELTQFATVLDDPTLLTGPERAELLQLLAVSWRSETSSSTTDEDAPDGEETVLSWSDALAAHREQSAATLDAVGIVEPTSVQLLSPGADLPVWVRNDLPYPANVVLYAEPDDVRLDVTRVIEVVAQPQSNTAVKVPVRARVGSGEVTVRLELRSPTGVAVGDAEYAQVTVRADWERIGVVILGTLVGGLLVIGVLRTLRRRRADRDAAAADEDGTGASDEGEDR